MTKGGGGYECNLNTRLPPKITCWDFSKVSTFLIPLRRGGQTPPFFYTFEGHVPVCIRRCIDSMMYCLNRNFCAPVVPSRTFLYILHLKESRQTKVLPYGTGRSSSDNTSCPFRKSLWLNLKNSVGRSSEAWIFWKMHKLIRYRYGVTHKMAQRLARYKPYSHEHNISTKNYWSLTFFYCTYWVVYCK
jgi:hypothetical protein